MTRRNFGLRSAAPLRLPPDVPRRMTKPPLSPVSWPDVGLAFMAGLICVMLGFLGVCWIFGG